MQNWLHPASMEEAKKAQTEMAEKVSLEDGFVDLKWIGGMDVSYLRFDPSKLIYASTVVLKLATLELVEHASVEEKQEFPYIPGFLGFREAPSLVHSFQKLQRKPDVLLVDGQGVSHPRRLGVASHIGVLLDIPTIGVAKSILVGKPAGKLGDESGSQVFLEWKDEPIGMLLRSKRRSHPLIISAGHKISLETSVKIVKQCLSGYKMPEPTRHAHLIANAFRKQNSQQAFNYKY